MAHHTHGVLWRRDAKQFKARVLHWSCLLNVHQQYLTEHLTRYPTAALNLILYQTRTVWHKDRESRPNRTRIHLQHQVANLFISSCNTSNQTNIRHSKLVLWRKTGTQSNVIINRKKDEKCILSVNNTKLGRASRDHSAKL